MSWLSQSLSGVSLSMDIGNLAVGLGTAAVAIVTLFISLKSSGDAKRLKMADYRKQWIEDVRLNCAEYAALVRAMLVLDASSKFFEESGEPDKQHEMNLEYKSNAEKFVTKHQYLLLMLNPDESSHAGLIKEMTSIRRDVFDIDRKDGIKLDNFVTLVRNVLKPEWVRVKSEM